MSHIEQATDQIQGAWAGNAPRNSFNYKLKQAAEQGLLLFIKYVLVVLLAYGVLSFMTNIMNGSSNGTQAAIYLNELQQKGYLPKVVNGQIPAKMEDEHASTK